MYNLISKVSAIDEDTGESIEIEFHQEQIVNDLGTTTITINNNRRTCKIIVPADTAVAPLKKEAFF